MKQKTRQAEQNLYGKMYVLQMYFFFMYFKKFKEVNGKT